jgi:hypothetical protein
VETIRGWYIWKKFEHDIWEAEVTKDPPGEVYRVRVLPWATTYRHLVYGARPDDLLPGERVNLFFAADDRHPRGYLVHFQDELCQMKGHGHVWEVRKLLEDGGFVARVLAGDKPLDDKELAFQIDPKCKAWRAGKPAEKPTLGVGDRVYLTWCLRDDRRVVVLVADDASLDAVKKEQQERVAAELAKEGITGWVEGVEGKSVRFLAFATYWSQAGQLKPGDAVRLTRTDKGFRPTGTAMSAKLVSQKNRGSYGSGVNDIVLELATADEAATVSKWADGSVVRLILLQPGK